ncbi:hypothetical protein ACFQYP_26750 [Nonomuraea antimicrobica]
MLDRVGEGLAGDEVQRGLDLRGEPRAETVVHGDGHPGPLGGSGERGAQAQLVERGGVDAPGHAAQFVEEAA